MCLWLILQLRVPLAGRPLPTEGVEGKGKKLATKRIFLQNQVEKKSEFNPGNFELSGGTYVMNYRINYVT